MAFARQLLLYPKWELKLLIFNRCETTLTSVVGHQPTLKKGLADFLACFLVKDDAINLFFRGGEHETRQQFRRFAGDLFR